MKRKHITTKLKHTMRITYTYKKLSLQALLQIKGGQGNPTAATNIDGGGHIQSRSEKLV